MSPYSALNQKLQVVPRSLAVNRIEKMLKDLFSTPHKTIPRIRREKTTGSVRRSEVNNPHSNV